MFCELLLASLLLFILIISSYIVKTWDKHVVHLKFVLDVPRKKKLFADKKKYNFFIDKLLFLRFVVGAQGIQADKKKVRAI